jgi:transposase-like protein
VLTRWRRQRLEQADAQAVGEDLKPSELAAELRKARQEVADLREQRDILKKALSIFSHRSTTGGRW